MGRQSTAIALIAIIFGVGGVGFGMLTMMNFQVQLNASLGGSGVVHSWYDEISSDTLDGTFAPISGLSVDIVVNAGEQVYMSYSGYVRIINTQVQFAIFINNTYQKGAQIDTATSTVNLMVCVSIQCVNNSLDPGTYTVNVWGEEQSGTECTVYSNTLFVQTFIP